jgi:hypothetical protein
MPGLSFLTLAPDDLLQDEGVPLRPGTIPLPFLESKGSGPISEVRSSW